MKKTILILSLVFVCGFTFAQVRITQVEQQEVKEEVTKETPKDTKVSTIVLNVQMDCANCEAKVQKQLAYTKGVKDVVTDLKNQVVTVTYETEKCSQDILVEEVNKLGYKVSVANTTNAANCNHNKSADCNKEGAKPCCKQKQATENK